MNRPAALAPLARWRERATESSAVLPTAAAGVITIVACFLLLHAAWPVTVPADLDSFNFTLATREFDVAEHRPHPPGAPIYVAIAKGASWAWTGLGLPADPLAGPEPAALGAVSTLAGALSILLAWQLLIYFGSDAPRTCRAIAVIASAPLLWLLAARPMSDSAGLAFVLATWLLLARGWIPGGALLAGLAVGLRVQTGLLTGPALLVALARRRSFGTAWTMCGSFSVGVAAWLVPLLVLSGGPRKYWDTLSVQATEDLAGPVLASTPTLPALADALFNTFVRPWGAPLLAAVVLTAAAAGAVRSWRMSPRRALAIAICLAPYAAFHLAFHDTGTIRYALPIVLVVAYLAATALEGLPPAWRTAAATGLVVASLSVSVPAAAAYSRAGSPALALFRAMHERAAFNPPAFVTGHARIMLGQLERVLPSRPWHTTVAPALREWQSTVPYWQAGGRGPLWFIADPRHADAAIVDPRSRRVIKSFGLPARVAWLANGVRPKLLTWWEVTPPSWIGQRGLALTPEIGGIAARDGHGPALDGAIVLIRRSTSGGVVAVGGRHVGTETDPPVHITIAVDDQTVGTGSASARSRDFAALVHLRPQQLAGETPYATLSVRSAPLTHPGGIVPVTVEHFDYQPVDGTLLALTSGWHEPELRPGTGTTWRWTSRRAKLLVHRPPGTTVALRLAGDLPAARRARRTPRVRVLAAGTVVDEFSAAPRFQREILLRSAPDDECDVEVVLESSFSFVPFERGENGDRRELAFRVFSLVVNRVPDTPPGPRDRHAPAPTRIRARPRILAGE